MLHDYVHLQYHQMREQDLLKEANEARLFNTMLRQKKERRRNNRKLLVSSIVQAARAAHRAARDARRAAWNESMALVHDNQNGHRVFSGI